MSNSSDYDYIIVGAGSAGCVLANRLTEDPDIKVLLLEAGKSDRHIWLKLPLKFRDLMTVKRFNWGYDTEPEPHLGNRSVYLAARQSARRFVLDQRHDVLPLPSEAITTSGDRLGCAAGPIRTCCPTSSARRISSAAPTSFTAPADRLPFRMPITRAEFTTPMSRPARRRAIPTRPITIPKGRRDSARRTSPSATAGARARRRCFSSPRMRRPNLTLLTGAHGHARAV